MSYRYKLHPLAQADYETSISWYLKRNLKAATNFVKAVDGGFSRICSDPKRYRNEYKHYYECVLPKYPFTIIFTIEENQKLIIIIAVYHQKRAPDEKYR